MRQTVAGHNKASIDNGSTKCRCRVSRASRPAAARASLCCGSGGHRVSKFLPNGTVNHPRKAVEGVSERVIHPIPCPRLWPSGGHPRRLGRTVEPYPCKLDTPAVLAGSDLLYPGTCIEIFLSSRRAGANGIRNSARGRRRRSRRRAGPLRTERSIGKVRRILKWSHDEFTH